MPKDTYILVKVCLDQDVLDEKYFTLWEVFIGKAMVWTNTIIPKDSKDLYVIRFSK